jgi:hypothetical protein
MEHAFDVLSKRMARATTRRQAMATLLRTALGTFLVSSGLGKFSLHAQSGACSACGTCQAVDFKTGVISSCAECEAQTLCNEAQSYSPYIQLAAALAGWGYGTSSYSALVVTGLPPVTQVLDVAYVGGEGATADLFVGWLSGAQMFSYAITYDSTGKPNNAYAVNSSGAIEVVIPIAPFAVSVSPDTVSVAPGSHGTTTTSVVVNSPFSSRIKMSASGFPTGATAKFRPASIPAPGSGSSTVTIKVNANTPTGTYPITITGQSQGAITETAALSLVVGTAALGSRPSRASDEFALHPLSLPFGVDPAAVAPPKSPCETCSRFCDVYGDLASVGCGALGAILCLPLGLGAGACALAASGLCVLLTKVDCVDRCENAYCSPPACNSSNCPSPGMCVDGACVQPPCGTGPCTCSQFICGDVCCPDGESCCDGETGEYCISQDVICK